MCFFLNFRSDMALNNNNENNISVFIYLFRTLVILFFYYITFIIKILNQLTDTFLTIFCADSYLYNSEIHEI